MGAETLSENGYQFFIRTQSSAGSEPTGGYPAQQLHNYPRASNAGVAGRHRLESLHPSGEGLEKCVGISTAAGT